MSVKQYDRRAARARMALDHIDAKRTTNLTYGMDSSSLSHRVAQQAEEILIATNVQASRWRLLSLSMQKTHTTINVLSYKQIIMYGLLLITRYLQSAKALGKCWLIFKI